MEPNSTSLCTRDLLQLSHHSKVTDCLPLPWSFAELPVKLVDHDSGHIVEVALEGLVKDLVLRHQGVVRVAEVVQVGSGFTQRLARQLLDTHRQCIKQTVHLNHPNRRPSMTSIYICEASVRTH